MPQSDVALNAGNALPDLWTAIREDTSWERCTGRGVRVAIVDSGIDTEHPDLKGKVVESVEAVAEVAETERIARPFVLGVTVLTSVDSETLAQIGIASSSAESVLSLAKLAEDSGLDGVVASPREALSIRHSTKPGFLIVTPGIRPAHAGLNDQKRVSTPAEALDAGADYLVVGRPITGAETPVEAAKMVLTEMENQ